MKRLLSIFAVFAVMLSLVCPYQMADAATVKINKTSLTMTVGKSDMLKITGTSKSIKWSSNDKSIVSVSSKGKIIAKAPGNATVTANVGNKKYTCKITVKKKHSDAYNNIIKNFGKELKLQDGTKVELKITDGNTIYKWPTLAIFEDKEIMCVVEGIRTVDPVGYMRYIIIDFSVMNLSDIDFISSDYYLSLQDGNQYTYSPSEYSYDNNVAPIGTLNDYIKPGGMARGEVAFEVQYNAPSIFILRYDISDDKIGRANFDIDLSDSKNQYGDPSVK